MKARKVKATFEIREDDYNAGVCYYIGGKKVGWGDLTAKEQVKILNAWASMYQLFFRFLKEEEQ